jgi:hypothetical protein
VRSMARASRTMVWRSVMGEQYDRAGGKNEADGPGPSASHVLI